MNITREYIEQLSNIEPHCFETDREEQWFNIGLQYGLDAADAQPKSPWISTDKYLPRNGGHYLCNDGDNHISALAFCGDRWFNSITFNDIPLEVVKYWMPIPKLPKE